VGFVLDKVVLEQGFLRALQFFREFQSTKSLNSKLIIIIIICNYLYAGYLELYTGNNVSRVYNIAAILWLQLIAYVTLLPMINCL
jgi:hypothetical protein